MEEVSKKSAVGIVWFGNVQGFVPIVSIRRVVKFRYEFRKADSADERAVVAAERTNHRAFTTKEDRRPRRFFNAQRRARRNVT